MFIFIIYIFLVKALFLFLQHEHKLLEKVILVGVNRYFGFAKSCFLLPSLKNYKILHKSWDLCIENILVSYSLFVSVKQLWKYELLIQKPMALSWAIDELHIFKVWTICTRISCLLISKIFCSDLNTVEMDSLEPEVFMGIDWFIIYLILEYININ